MRGGRVPSQTAIVGSASERSSSHRCRHAIALTR
jgi:hypothetical protein